MSHSDWSDEKETAWTAWLTTLPPEVREVVERFRPDKTYRLRTTGQHCRLVSFEVSDSDRTVLSGPLPPSPLNTAVTFTAVCWNPKAPDLTRRTVFGINPKDLEVVEGE